MKELHGSRALGFMGYLTSPRFATHPGLAFNQAYFGLETHSGEPWGDSKGLVVRRSHRIVLRGDLST